MSAVSEHVQFLGKSLGFFISSIRDFFQDRDVPKLKNFFRENFLILSELWLKENFLFDASLWDQQLLSRLIYLQILLEKSYETQGLWDNSELLYVIINLLIDSLWIKNIELNLNLSIPVNFSGTESFISFIEQVLLFISENVINDSDTRYKLGLDLPNLVLEFGWETELLDIWEYLSVQACASAKVINILGLGQVPRLDPMEERRPINQGFQDLVLQTLDISNPPELTWDEARAVIGIPPEHTIETWEPELIRGDEQSFSWLENLTASYPQDIITFLSELKSDLISGTFEYFLYLLDDRYTWFDFWDNTLLEPFYSHFNWARGFITMEIDNPTQRQFLLDFVKYKLLRYQKELELNKIELRESFKNYLAEYWLNPQDVFLDWLVWDFFHMSNLNQIDDKETYLREIFEELRFWISDFFIENWVEKPSESFFGELFSPNTKMTSETYPWDLLDNMNSREFSMFLSHEQKWFLLDTLKQAKHNSEKKPLKRLSKWLKNLFKKWKKAILWSLLALWISFPSSLDKNQDIIVGEDLEIYKIPQEKKEKDILPKTDVLNSYKKDLFTEVSAKLQSWDWPLKVFYTMRSQMSIEASELTSDYLLAFAKDYLVSNGKNPNDYPKNLELKDILEIVYAYINNYIEVFSAFKDYKTKLTSNSKKLAFSLYTSLANKPELDLKRFWVIFGFVAPWDSLSSVFLKSRGDRSYLWDFLEYSKKAYEKVWLTLVPEKMQASEIAILVYFYENHNW